MLAQNVPQNAPLFASILSKKGYFLWNTVLKLDVSHKTHIVTLAQTVVIISTINKGGVELGAGTSPIVVLVSIVKTILNIISNKKDLLSQQYDLSVVHSGEPRPFRWSISPSSTLPELQPEQELVLTVMVVTEGAPPATHMWFPSQMPDSQL